MYAVETADIQEDSLYIEMFHELSKYKTLSHSEIDWQKVFENSLLLLEKSLDTRIFRGFVLSVIAINNKDVITKFKDVIEHYNKVWVGVYSELLNGNSKSAKIQLKFFVDPVNELIEANNTHKLNVSNDIVAECNKIFNSFNDSLKTNFPSMVETKKEEKLVDKANKVDSFQSTGKSIESMDVREYREYFFNLGRKLLAKDIDNIAGYSFFWEAVWGKIVQEIPHKNFITEIRYPEQNTIDIVKKLQEYSYDNVVTALSNIFLNPFWFEGYKIFIDYSIKAEKKYIAEHIKTLVRLQLEKYKWIKDLCFSNKTAFCSQELYDYFFKEPSAANDVPAKEVVVETAVEVPVVVKGKKEKADSRSLKSRLASINGEIDGSLKSKVDGLIHLAEIMKSNGFDNNAEILYQEVLNIMNTTLLKDYLTIEYNNIINLQSSDK